MKVIICEDNQKILEFVTEKIRNHIIINELDIKISISTKNPDNILEELSEEDIGNCYFLDIDLGKEKLTGIELGKKIREVDPFAKLIYITSHDEMRINVLEAMVEPLAYIIKDSSDFKEKIIPAFNKAYEIYSSTLKKNPNTNKVAIPMGSKSRFFDINDVLYFEAIGEHKISLNLKNNEKVKFFGKISEIENFHDSLFYCHRSYVVNLSTIDDFNKDSIIFDESL